MTLGQNIGGKKSATKNAPVCYALPLSSFDCLTTTTTDSHCLKKFLIKLELENLPNRQDWVKSRRFLKKKQTLGRMEMVRKEDYKHRQGRQKMKISALEQGMSSELRG